jgi:AcrR family transcriptional regulator
MPPRPSRNLDQALLAAGRALFPERGCGAMSVREVADAAGVNLGMFHYHFKSRDAFLRALMQQTYEEMFARLSLEVARGVDPVVNLRSALRAIARFVRDNRPFLARVLADALCGEQCAREFLRENLPRHLGVLQALIEAGQKEGRLAPIPVLQALGTCAGALAMPILFGGALVASGTLAAPTAKRIEATLLSDSALDQRIDLVLAAISISTGANALPAAKAAKNKAAKKKRGRS